MKKIHTGIIFQTIIGILVIELLVLGYTFILQRNYNNSALDESVARNKQCADAIHKHMSDKFVREDFDSISSIDDIGLPRYKKLQKQLNELRLLNSTRYLYTVKKTDDGKLIYLVDGLDLDADDYAYPGTLIEKEMVTYIEQALSGKVVYSNKIVDTTWGHIFTACYPVEASDGTGDIIGALCMEMDMESTYACMEADNHRAFMISIIAIVVFAILANIVYIYLRKQKYIKIQQREELEKAVSAADAANSAKSAFLFNMSHDIRTPMNAILGFTQLAEQEAGVSDKVKEYLQKIRISGNKMLSIIDNVLELSRIESGKVTIEETPVAAGSIIDDCVVMIQAEIDKKKQQLTVSKEIIYPYIYMDTVRITEIILNLMSNSIKYTNDGGRIHCAISQKEDEREGWCIQELTVSDNGIGMTREFQKHIYESFTRERSSTASGIAGTGLGMGIVKKLVDMMDGTIDLQSKVGEGTTFRVRIPCRIATQEDTQPKTVENIGNPEDLKGIRILLAEDNDLNAEIAVTLLSEVGFMVERAANGVDCVEMLKDRPAGYYSIILMDIQMPVLDGYNATSNIRRMDDKAKASIPIVAMTANAFAEDREKALSVGMNDHIAKPVDMSKLIPTIRKYIK